MQLNSTHLWQGPCYTVLLYQTIIKKYGLKQILKTCYHIESLAQSDWSRQVQENNKEDKLGREKVGGTWERGECKMANSTYSCKSAQVNPFIW